MARPVTVYVRVCYGVLHAHLSCYQFPHLSMNDFCYFECDIE
jgi:hypothetical protein